MEKINKISDLKKWAGRVVYHEESEFPLSVFYNFGMEHPIYKFTVEILEQNYFIDAKGQKWIKAKEEDNESL